MQILAAKPEAKTIAFEPSSRFRPYLMRNLKLAGAENVEVYPWAVGRVWGEINRLGFLKIDTDGFELEILRGGESALRTFRPALQVELATYLIPDPEEQWVWLQKLGYEDFLCHTPTGGRLGITDDPEQASAWATAEESRYCDIVTCFRRDAYALQNIYNFLEQGPARSTRVEHRHKATPESRYLTPLCRSRKPCALDNVRRGAAVSGHILKEGADLHIQRTQNFFLLLLAGRRRSRGCPTPEEAQADPGPSESYRERVGPPAKRTMPGTDERAWE